MIRFPPASLQIKSSPSPSFCCPSAEWKSLSHVNQDQCNVEQSLNLQFSSQICFVFLLLGARRMKRWAGVELIQTCVEETIVEKSIWQKQGYKPFVLTVLTRCMALHWISSRECWTAQPGHYQTWFRDEFAVFVLLRGGVMEHFATLSESESFITTLYQTHLTFQSICLWYLCWLREAWDEWGRLFHAFWFDGKVL